MDLEETRAFIAVIDNGSFKAAAERVKQPRATLRRRVEALESRAGVQLLERSRAGVVATPAGQLLAREGRVMLRETNALLAALREIDDEPSGDIHISAPAGLPPQALAIVFGLFQAQFPRLHLNLQICDDPLAELTERVDVALYFGRDKPRGRWHAHTLLSTHEGLAASRSYLQRHGMPRTIDDLSDHKLLGWQAPGERPRRWPTYEGGSFPVKPALTTSNYDVLRRFAHLGLGIALLPDSELPKLDTVDEPLIPVLGELVGCTHELRAAVPEALAETPKISAIVEHLRRYVATIPSHAELPVASAGAGLQGLHQQAM